MQGRRKISSFQKTALLLSMLMLVCCNKDESKRTNEQPDEQSNESEASSEDDSSFFETESDSLPEADASSPETEPDAALEKESESAPDLQEKIEGKDTNEYQPGGFTTVEIVWNDGKSDIDIHYIRSGAKYGDTNSDNPGGDCHWGNPEPNYCSSDNSDDPLLKIDDPHGYGPEEIIHPKPCPDEYRIWVSCYNDGGYENIAVQATIYSYLFNVTREYVLERRDCHWLVGRVLWPEGRFVPATENNYVCGKPNPED